MNKPVRAPKKPFVLEEATIDELHVAIKAGETTCVDVVEHYLARVRAFNGASNLLVTKDGAPIPEAPGTVRGGAPLKFPTQTVKASELLPDLDNYKGPPLEFGRMEATASDTSVQQQFGLTVGQPNAGQVNALATLNIRGERSVTCRGDFLEHLFHGTALLHQHALGNLDLDARRRQVGFLDRCAQEVHERPGGGREGA